ncbi:replication-relaxation family protein [Niallia taxi]|uniref:replication-relaxation family protein n=1 Tax=Niallia taxi TaxID=2499688 RepID=UPI0015F50D63|nr:replication-relaxation family protein [Niallia taxi]MDK8640741.1 replication-relaxation family protein [Niallia taxi]
MDKDQKVWYSMKYTRKGAWINTKDLELLKLLYTNRILTLKQIKRYGRYIFNSPESTIKSKLKRWLSNNIVSIDYLRTLGKPAVSCYQIGKNGFHILRNEKIIEDEELVEVNIKNIKQPSHYFGIQDVVIDTLIEMKDKLSTVSSTHPNYRTYLSCGTKLNKEETIIIPDWKIETAEGRILNIEFDTGSQNLTRIHAKVDNYMELAKVRPAENHFVLFVVADNRSEIYTTEYASTRETRVLNIKELIINKLAHRLENLHFYVCSAYRASSIASNILKGIYPIKQSHKESEIELAILSVQLNDDIDYTMEPRDASVYYSNDVSEEFYADSHYSVIDHLSNKKMDFIFKIAEEGSVVTLDKLSYLETLISTNRIKQEVEKMNVLYLSTAAMQNDVIPKDFQNTSFSQTQLWHYKNIQTPKRTNEVVRVLE